MFAASSWFWMILLAACFASLWWCVRIFVQPFKQIPLAVYCVAYTVTTLIGGASIGLFGLDFFESLNYGEDHSMLRDVSSFRYWFMLFAPLLIPPACVLLTARVKKRRVERRPAHASQSGMALPSFYAIVGIFAGFCGWKLHVNGYLGVIMLWHSEDADFNSLMLQRHDIFNSMGQAFFGITYTVMPTMLHYALFQMVRTRSLDWMIAFLLTLLLTLFFNLSVFVKSFVLINIIWLGLGLVLLKVIKLRSLAIFFACAFAGLTLMQSTIVEHWQLADSFRQIVYRMSVAFPFYVNVYPDHLPFDGIYLGLNAIGIGEPSGVSEHVFNFMYPSITHIQGHAVAAAHVDAYAQGGMLYAMTIVTLIGLMLAVMPEVASRLRGPTGYVLFVQLLIFTYYLTQTSLVTAVIGAYGFAWAIIGLLPLWIAERFVASYGQPRRLPMRPGLATIATHGHRP